MFHDPAVGVHRHIGPAHLEYARLVTLIRQRDLGTAYIVFKHDFRWVHEQDGTGPGQQRGQREDGQ